MKVLYLNYSDGRHGAGIGAFRTFSAIKKYCPNIDISMLVCHKYSNDPDVYSIRPTLRSVFWNTLSYVFNRFIKKIIFVSENRTLHSVAFFPVISHNYINNSSYDIILLHGICDSLLSIESIGKITKPIVWKMADEWFFSGAEHYGHVSFNGSLENNNYSIDRRFENGYHSKCVFEKGFNLNNWTWKRKTNHFPGSIHLIATSSFMYSKAKSSLIAKNNPISVITNSINPDDWPFISKSHARHNLSVNSDDIILSIGAISFDSDERKGGRHLISIFNSLATLISNSCIEKNILVLAFGVHQNSPFIRQLPFKTSSFGHVKSLELLNYIYSASDLFICPSILESFGQTAAEAQVCGTPVASFKIGGFCDIVEDLKTGVLIEPYDVDLFARVIFDLIAGKVSLQSKKYISSRALAQFSPLKVAQSYNQVFQQVKSCHGQI